MTTESLKKLVLSVVKMACSLKDRYTAELKAPVNYACLFSHSKKEFEELRKLTMNFGKVLEETPSGPLFHIQPLQTVSGKLQILKIRMPDEKHLDLGDADFTVSNYALFKKNYLEKPNFKLIERPGMEMIELMDPLSDTRAYFSYPPIDQQFGIN